MKFRLFFIAVGVIIILALYLFSSKESAVDPSMIDFLFGDKTLSVEIADTIESRTLGLSGRQSLPEEVGLLFVFDTPVVQGFWMKDMGFPIDILWFDAEKRLVDITEDLSPDSFPETFYPNQPIMYVLETNIDQFSDPEQLLGKSFELSTR